MNPDRATPEPSLRSLVTRLDLHLDHRRLDCQRIMGGDDVDAAVGTFRGHAREVAHSSQHPGDKVLCLVAIELGNLRLDQFLAARQHVLEQVALAVPVAAA